jgi:ankyrin repeat protein
VPIDLSRHTLRIIVRVVRAAANGLEVVVKQLLATDGVDWGSKDNEGRTPLSWASENGHKAEVKLLLAKNGVNLHSGVFTHAEKPLLQAAMDGHDAVVEMLLYNGSHVNQQNVERFSETLSRVYIGGWSYVKK